MPAGVVEQAVERLDDAAREAAAAEAAEGAQRLREAGVEAEAMDRAADGAAWRTLAALATETGADVVVVGSRGRSDAGSLVLGSTSHGLVHHCGVPVLVVNPDR
jgi:nucleotide-binding universal stress UspA family protein